MKLEHPGAAFFAAERSQQFERDFEARKHLMAAPLAATVRNLAAAPNWIGAEDRFWMALDEGEGLRYWIYEAATGQREPAFDHAAVAAALGTSIDALPVSAIKVENRTRTLIADNAQYRCHADGSSLTRLPATLAGTLAAPGDNCLVLVQDHNLWVCDADGGNRRQLTTDGESGYAYGDDPVDLQRIIRRRTGQQATPAGIAFAPCGRYLLAARTDLRDAPERCLAAEFAVPGQRYTQALTARMHVAGDHVPPKTSLTIVDLDSGAQRMARLGADALADYAFVYLGIGCHWWWKDKVYLITGSWRGNRYGVAEVSLTTGSVHMVLEETAEYFLALNSEDYHRPNVRVLAGAREMIWYSQRSGYGHLYLYDIATGAEKNAITGGDWLVNNLLYVDEARRLVYFSASGRQRNPYQQQLCRGSLDGGEVTVLTPEEGHHAFTTLWRMPVPAQASISPGGRYFVDHVSTVLGPPRCSLHRIDGSLVKELYRVDARAMTDVPHLGTLEPVETLAADGETLLYGVMFKPPGFNPAVKYPVIQHTYSGPQGAWSPAGFTDTIRNSAHNHAWLAASMGFVVLVFDGRGCSGRSAAFRYAFADSEDVLGSADSVAGICHLAAKFPFLDLERVGNTGVSFGGYGAMRAQLLNSGFFKVTVAGVAPCDFRAMSLALTNDRFFRNSDDIAQAEAWYETVSNTRLAGCLQGRQLLIHGEIDENVPLNQAFLMYEAYQKAGKSYDSLVLPNQGHGAAATEYAVRETMRYFCAHL